MLHAVTFVSPRYPPYVGGVETHVSELAVRAATRFRKVSVVTTDPSGRLPATEQIDGGPMIYRIRSFAPRENYHFPLVTSLFKSLRRCPSEILHLHSIHDIPGPLAAIFESKSPLVFTPHFHGEINSTLGKILFTTYRPILRKLIERVARIICVSRFEARLMRNAFPRSSGKIELISNGLDFQLLSKYSWCPPEQPNILYVGRLERYKNVDKILGAVAELRKKNSQVNLTVVGRGPIKNELVDLAARLGLGRNVEWLEGLRKPTLYQLYSSSSAVVLPSELEAYGIVAAEAIGLGVPTIVANSSGLSEFVEAGLALGVEPPITREILAARISEVLENPETFSVKDRSSELLLSWEEVAERTFALYESMSVS